jgi:hypothetical protein
MTLGGAGRRWRPRGAQITCPHIEKSCTSAMYSDRKLEVSETIATSAATIHFFTGNHRSLGERARLKHHVDEPVPCNGNILSLKETRDTHKGTLKFYVACRPAE